MFLAPWWCSQMQIDSLISMILMFFLGFRLFSSGKAVFLELLWCCHQLYTVFQPRALLNISRTWSVNSLRCCESSLLRRVCFTAESLPRLWCSGSFSQSGLQTESLVSPLLNDLAGILLRSSESASGLNISLAKVEHGSRTMDSFSFISNQNRIFYIFVQWPPVKQWLPYIADAVLSIQIHIIGACAFKMCCQEYYSKAVLWVLGAIVDPVTGAGQSWQLAPWLEGYFDMAWDYLDMWNTDLYKDRQHERSPNVKNTINQGISLVVWWSIGYNLLALNQCFSILLLKTHKTRTASFVLSFLGVPIQWELVEQTLKIMTLLTWKHSEYGSEGIELEAVDDVAKVTHLYGHEDASGSQQEDVQALCNDA